MDQDFYNKLEDLQYDYGKLEMKAAAMRQALAMINQIAQVEKDGSMTIKPNAEQAYIIKQGLQEVGL